MSHSRLAKSWANCWPGISPAFPRPGRGDRDTQIHGGSVMLVLSRRNGEQIVIDGNIKVTIIEIHGRQVRLGIEAPDDVRVLREELVACDEPVAACSA